MIRVYTAEIRKPRVLKQVAAPRVKKSTVLSHELTYVILYVD